MGCRSKLTPIFVQRAMPGKKMCLLTLYEGAVSNYKKTAPYGSMGQLDIHLLFILRLEPGSYP